MWITDLRSGDKDAGTEWSDFMLARPLPARPFMSAAGLPWVTVGTVSAMLDDMGERVSEAEAESLVGRGRSMQGWSWIKVSERVEWGAGNLSCQKSN